MNRVIAAAKGLKLNNIQRQYLYDEMIDALEDQDADTLDECRGRDKVFDECLDHRRDPD